MVADSTKEVSMKTNKLHVIDVSDSQKEWLEGEKKRTKGTYASIVRGLIQEKINKEERKKRAPKG